MSWHFSVTRLGDRVLRKTQKKKNEDRKKNQRAERRGGGGEQKMERTNQKTNNPEKTRQKGKAKRQEQVICQAIDFSNWSADDAPQSFSPSSCNYLRSHR